MYIFWILVAIGLAYILIKFKIKHTQNIGNLTIVTGGVKAGKSTLSVHLALRRIKKARMLWKLKKLWCIVRQKELPEEPLLYSNVPLAVEYYTPVTKDLMLRKKRFNYKSVIYLQEASLVADSMTTYDYELNESTLMLFKLIAHETKGGYLIADTQCITDVHYNLKRSISTYLYVHRTFKWCPFILFAKVQEKCFDPVNTINVNTGGDMDNEQYRWIIFSKKTWKAFDRYCYSVLTDDLPTEGKGTMPCSLKATEVITFRKEKKNEIQTKSGCSPMDTRNGSTIVGVYSTKQMVSTNV